MAPATDKCRPSSLSEVTATVDTADDESPDPPSPAADSSCGRCCGVWQQCCGSSRARTPRGTDKAGAGTDDKETLLSGGKTRFYCCETKMTTRPARVGPNRTKNSRNTSEKSPLQATPVSPGLCSLFRRKDDSSVCEDVSVSPVEVAFDALTFNEQAYLEEFEEIHREDYDLSRTTVNPVTPHVEILLHPSQVGRVIIIKGRTYENAQGFAVNLICRERREIAMHFNPRLDRGYIARNTKLNGHWGVEENSLNGPSPFEADQEFTLHILVAEDEYRFCHNGRHVCSYKHRVPIARLHTLEVNGDVDLSLVKHEMVEEFPPPVPPVAVADLLRDNRLLSVGHTALLIPTTHSWRENIPKQSYFFLGRFEPNIAIGHEIIIGGHVKLLPHAFFINLQDGLQMWKPPEVHLHINPRFEDHNHVVINARLRGKWGYEERHARCRFQPGRPFTLIIRVEEDRYRTFVNGCVLASMDHRARPSEINSIYISGDIDITSIGYNNELTTLKPTGTTHKEVTIAEDPDWVDLAADRDNPNITFSPSDSRSSIIDGELTSQEKLISGVVEQVLTSVVVEEGNTILDTYKEGANSGRRQKKSSVERLESLGDIVPAPVDRPPSPHTSRVMPEQAEPVPGTSRNENSSLPEGKSSVSNITLPVVTGVSSLPHFTDSESQAHSESSAVAVQIERLGSRESVTAVQQDLHPSIVNSETLLPPEKKTSVPTTGADSQNGQPLLQESVESAARAEAEASRARGESSISDDSIFLSAEHTLNESLDDSKSKTASKVTLKSETDKEQKSK